jgi:hypothetical protein
LRTFGASLPNAILLNPNSALENSNAELTKKLLYKHFLSAQRAKYANAYFGLNSSPRFQPWELSNRSR